MFGRVFVGGTAVGGAPPSAPSWRGAHLMLRQQSDDTGAERSGGHGAECSGGAAVCWRFTRGVIHPWRGRERGFASLPWRSGQRGVRARLRGGYGGRGRSPFRTLVAWPGSMLRQQSVDPERNGAEVTERSVAEGRRSAGGLPVALSIRGVAGSGACFPTVA